MSNQRKKFGLLVSVTFSLAMNISFLKFYGQPFSWVSWLMQLPLTIPAGALAGIACSMLVNKFASHWSQGLKGFLFSVVMSIVMSCIMTPFALIPRVGFDSGMIASASFIGVFVGIIVAYLVVPACHLVVYKRWAMPEL
ncbi:hypothetical protein JCM19235_2279 [Vibrio maritimus]|uniref:Uncharacterized protein n=1 Tax=Vibrio maritimus TaxID=990268 RepID=A0A090RU87_9VIBR|nr:hypothetical protein JCM19235_2279 [Vibrio maritimus]